LNLPPGNGFIPLSRSVPEGDQKASRSELPVQAARIGSAAAWAALFRRFRLPLFVYVYQLLQNREDAFDVVQETFCNATRYLGGLRDDDKFAPWLFHIAHQKCLRHWERQGKRMALAEPFDDAQAAELHDQTDNPRDWLIHKEREGEIMALIDQLPLPQRSALMLHCVEEFSLEEIAEIMAVPVGTVKSRLHHAKRALREKLGKNPS
jgi:RNA polymerase sigma-70 factor (ECF subfamily)